MLALEVVIASPEIFNPLTIPDPGYTNQTAITGNWVALPTATANYPSGWTPSGPISWNVPISIGFGGSTTVIRTLPGTSAVSGTGTVGTLSTSWDGKSTSGVYQQGFFNFTANATVTVPSGTASPPTSTIATYTINRTILLVCRCPKEGPSSNSVPVDMLDFPVGPSIEMGLAYNSTFATGQSASMGYGWSNLLNVKLYKDAAQNVTYKNEYGVYWSWTFSGGIYTPSTGDNYVSLTTSASFPNYTLTFPDQSKRLFNNASPPQLINEVDPRGQTTTYAYTGTHLTQITDAKGRNLYYINNADGQVASIRAINATTGNQTRFIYWPNTDPVAPNRLQQTITPAGDATVYYYSTVPIGPALPVQQYQAMVTAIQDPTGKIAVQYGYDTLGRVVQEQWYDQKYTSTYYETAFTVNASNQVVYIVANAVTKIVQDLTGASPTQTSTAYYDNFFNVIRLDVLVDANANPVIVNTTTNTYADPVNPNLLTKTVDPNLNMTAMTFDSKGNMLTHTDAYSSVTTITYNAASQPLTIQRPAVTVTPGSAPITYTSTVMTYDAFGATQVIRGAAILRRQSRHLVVIPYVFVFSLRAGDVLGWPSGRRAGPSGCNGWPFQGRRGPGAFGSRQSRPRGPANAWRRRGGTSAR
jgi:YD repeat-containing protein